MINNREAPEIINGFFYQRYCCIYYVLCNDNYEYVLEEGYEDIDFININNQREIIQVKYYGNFTESLTINSGLYKVIISNFEKNNIDKIIYYAYNKTDTIYHKKLISVFNDKYFFNIGKYLLLIIYKNLDKKITVDITNIDSINNLYEKYEEDIKNTLINNYKLTKEEEILKINLLNKNKLIEKEKNYNYFLNIFNFFSNENNCNSYFSKFNLQKGQTYDELNKNINIKITEKFTEFINTNIDENKNLRITLVKNTILNILTDKMFKNIKSIDRKIKQEDIFIIINEKIKTYTNPNNLYFELLKQTEQIISDYLNKNHNERLNINEYINQIKNIKINSLDNISFYICLLNNYYNKLKEDDINYIKKYMISFILKYKFNNNNIFLLIKYLNMIVIRTHKSYKIPHEKLIKLIDDKHKINYFFNKK